MLCPGNALRRGCAREHGCRYPEIAFACIALFVGHSVSPYADIRWTEPSRQESLCGGSRAALLHGNHHIRLCLHAIHACCERDISGAKACGQYQIDLVKASAGQSGEGWDDAHVVDEEVHVFSG